MIELMIQLQHEYEKKLTHKSPAASPRISKEPLLNPQTTSRPLETSEDPLSDDEIL